MKVQINKKVSSKSGILVVPVFEDHLKKVKALYPTAVESFLLSLVKNSKFKGKKGEKIFSFLESKGLPEQVLFIGFGNSAKYNSAHARDFGAIIAKSARAQKVTDVSLIILSEMIGNIEELLEGVLMMQYKVDLMKTPSKDDKHYFLENLELIVENKHDEIEKGLKKSQTICEAVGLVKNLVNLPSNIVDGDYLAREARKIAKENKYKIAVFGNKELKKMAWGGILAVNQGSFKEAKCLVLQYDGAKDKKERPIVVVGKGVIFDTGGYNLKPTNNIETMHQDMAGAATVLGLFSILKKLGIQKNVVGITPIAENLVNDLAYRPSDIIKMFSGKTVEITNTDAEGRLILADAITYGTKLDPQAIITIATLTGAVAVALGERYAGLIGNDLKLRARLQKAGKETNELGWPLPLHKDFKKKMDSDIADLRNCDMGSSRMAGSSKGAAFLERFVDGKKWCHIDIGGTAFTTEPQEFQTKYATAHGLRMLTRFFENLN